MSGIAGQTLSYALAIVFIRLQAFILLPFVTRYIPKDEISVFDTLFGYGIIVGMITLLGVDSSMATLYRNPDHEHNQRNLAWNSVAIVAVASLVGGLALFCLTGPIEQYVFKGQWELGVEVALVGALVVVTSLQSILANILRQEFQLKKFNTAVIGGGILSFTVTLLAVIWLGLGIRGMLLAMVLTGVLKVALLGWWAQPWMEWGTDFRLIRRLLVIGLPMLPVSVCAWFMAGFDRTLLQMWRSPAEVADYGMAYRFAMAGTVITGAFQTAWWPYAMSRAREPGISEHFQQICRIFCVGGALLAAGIAAATPVAMWTIMPPEYNQSFQSTGLQSLRGVVNVYYYFPLVSLLVATSIRKAVIAYFAGMLVTVGLNFALVKPFGVPGAVMASVLGFLTMAAVVGRMARKEFDFGFPLVRIEMFFLLCGAILALWVWIPVKSAVPVVGVAALTTVLILGAGMIMGILTRGDAEFAASKVQDRIHQAVRKIRRRPA